ncbi:MAG: glycosyltransferase family 2 protein [Chthoniobacterales bacterium]|nr:glycosyltransferase family 2 protein [Chthoniobacterales bacterium]
MIKISILIPTFNRVAMVCEALDRIMKYDCEEVFEVIVSDNHSSDNTLQELASKYKNFKKLKLTQPPSSCGPIFNWQHALSQASGTHVHWHWSDDYLCGPFYEQAVALMKKEQVNVIISAVKIIFEDGFAPTLYSQGFDRRDSSEKALKKLLIEQTLPISPAACILPLDAVKKHFYTEIPAFRIYDPIKWAMGTDALMIAGSLLENSKVAYLEKPLFCFQSHEGSLTNLQANYCISYFVAFEWFIRKEKLPIPLSLRRKVLGLTMCNSFEKKFSLVSLTGFLMHLYKVFLSKF